MSRYFSYYDLKSTVIPAQAVFRIYTNCLKPFLHLSWRHFDKYPHSRIFKKITEITSWQCNIYHTLKQLIWISLTLIFGYQQEAVFRKYDLAMCSWSAWIHSLQKKKRENIVLQIKCCHATSQNEGSSFVTNWDVKWFVWCSCLK